MTISAPDSALANPARKNRCDGAFGLGGKGLAGSGGKDSDFLTPTASQGARSSCRCGAKRNDRSNKKPRERGLLHETERRSYAALP
ncbi:hypothetical protein [Sinimarinibacterium thermocellulolyticum]|uniref:Uncharacterized protein n=1 Tax=Sinimarinibacterium thermocellulolyticum TaxID=3170016 RepID=A0ABV2AC84_9GAMM